VCEANHGFSPTGLRYDAELRGKRVGRAEADTEVNREVLLILI